MSQPTIGRMIALDRLLGRKALYFPKNKERLGLAYYLAWATIPSKFYPPVFGFVEDDQETGIFGVAPFFKWPANRPYDFESQSE